MLLLNERADFIPCYCCCCSLLWCSDRVFHLCSSFRLQDEGSNNIFIFVHTLEVTFSTFFSLNLRDSGLKNFIYDMISLYGSSLQILLYVCIL